MLTKLKEPYSDIKKNIKKSKQNNMSFFEDTTSKEVNNSLWVEKYGYRKPTEYVGNEHLKQR